MRDSDVRSAVRARLYSEHAGESDTKIVEEMGVWSGSVRIDVAVINGELCGYELKSDKDTLQRLPAQAELYSSIFDRVWLVVGNKHLTKARAIVPKWWGVIAAKDVGGAVELTAKREAKSNPQLDPIMLARLLWRAEAIQILDERGLSRGVKSKPVGVLHKKIATDIPLPELSTCVRETLKARTGWLG